MTTTHEYELSEEAGGDEVIEAEDLDAAIADCEAWIRDGDYGVEGAMVRAWVEPLDGDDPALDDPRLVCGRVAIEVEIEPNHGTLIARAVYDAGLDEADVCGYSPDDHDWTGDGEGGCQQNPGVWSLGGTRIVIAEHCTRCRLHRRTVIAGAQRDPGEHDKVEYSLDETRE
jgi:hypothetical protein